MPETLQHDGEFPVTKSLLPSLVECFPSRGHNDLHAKRAELECSRRGWRGLVPAGSQSHQQHDGERRSRHDGNSMLERIASNTASDSFNPMNVQMKRCE